MADLSAAKPDPLEIVEKRADGSGVVRVPIIKAGQSIDLSLTSGKSKGAWDVSREHLAEMVANFKAFPGPVPIGVSPHKDFGERSGFSVAFLERLTVKGDDLLGDVWCMTPLFADVVAGHWRGFSGEFGRDMTMPTVELNGWCIYGGVFTNRPATESNFVLQVAAEGAPLDADRFSTRHKAQKELGMQETVDLSVRLATVEAEAKVNADKIASLEAKAKELREENVSLESRVLKAEKDAENAQAEAQAAKIALDRGNNATKDAEGRVVDLESANKKLRAEVQNAKDLALSQDVTKTVAAAIRSGIGAAAFDGYDKDPVAWLRGSYVTLENLQRVISGLPKSAALSGTTSGRKSDDDPDSVVPPNVALELKRMGLDPKYSTVKTSEDLVNLK